MGLPEYASGTFAVLGRQPVRKGHTKHRREWNTNCFGVTSSQFAHHEDNSILPTSAVDQASQLSFVQGGR